jgi:signal transduction histidine kinase
MKIRLTLTTKLTITFALFASLLLAVVSTLAYTSGRSALESAAVAELFSTAIEKQSALNAWVEETQTDAVSLSASPYFQEGVANLITARVSGNQVEVQAAHQHLIAEMQVWAGQNRDYLGWMLLDPDSGQVIAATDPTEEDKFRENQPYFIQGKSGSYLQNVYYSTSLQATLMTVSAPLRSPDGTLLAVLAGNLNLDKMNTIITRRTGLRQSDDAFLVNSSELVVTQPRFIRDPAVLLRTLHTQAVTRCLARNSGNLNAPDYRGVPSFIVYRWLPERQLCLIVKMDQSEALAPSLALRNTILLISLLALLVAIALAWWLARTITHPVQQLTKGAAEIGSGNLEYRIPLMTNDEIGQLAGEFNRMAGSLELMQVQLSQRAGQLESANQELEAFSYSISHDLRAPLRAMDGFSRILLEDHATTFSAEAVRYLNLVRDNAQQMGRLIEDLLAFSRLSRMPLNKQHVDTADLVQKVLADLHTSYELRDMEISVGGLPSCQADPALLKQVWMNLLANALKYTRKHDSARIEIGFLPAVTLPSLHPGLEKEVAGAYYVRDNGVGFDMQYAHKLFGVFQRLHKVEDYEGTGVGLAIVQRIVLRHGGRVWVEAQVDKGATFYFTLEGGLQ